MQLQIVCTNPVNTYLFVSICTNSTSATNWQIAYARLSFVNDMQLKIIYQSTEGRSILTNSTNSKAIFTNGDRPHVSE